MKDFAYASPRSEQEAVALLADPKRQTEVLAGGTDLVGRMKKMQVTPDLVVNIMDVESLKAIERWDDGTVVLGAAVTLDELLESPYTAPFTALRQAIANFDSMQLQAQGTLGGELCQRPRCWYYQDNSLLNADPAADTQFHAIFGNNGPAKFVSSPRLAPALISLGAQVRLLKGAEEEPLQERFVPLAEFFRTPRFEGQRETVLEPGELLTHVLLPAPEGLLSGHYDVRHGAGPDYPLASAAVGFRHSGGVVREARIVLGQVAPVPWAATEAARQLVGQTITPAVAEAIGELAVQQATPLRDNQYKVQLAKVAVKRALLQAAGMETGGF